MKKGIVVLLCTLLSFSMIGCSKKESLVTTENNTTSEEYGNDLTAKITSNGVNDISEVSSVMSSEAFFLHITNNIEDIVEAADKYAVAEIESAVYGKIESVEYVDVPQVGALHTYSHMKFRVQECDDGKFVKGDLISVVTQGGYTTMGNIRKVYGDETKKGDDPTKKLPDNAVVEDKRFGVAIPKVGEEMLCFISGPTNGFPKESYSTTFMYCYKLTGNTLVHVEPEDSKNKFYKDSTGEKNLTKDQLKKKAKDKIKEKKEKKKKEKNKE